MRPTLSIVVPCYNEEAALPHLLDKLRLLRCELQECWNLEYVFVDDGSRDGTGVILAELDRGNLGGPVRVVTHPSNCGLGAALASGFAVACGDFVAALDCDCTYDPMYLPAMLAWLDEETDVVGGSEFHPDGRVLGVSRLRLLFSRAMCGMYRWLFWTKIHSFSCILRVYRRRVVHDVPIDSAGFLSCTEILMRALFAGYRIREFPVTLTARQHGDSKIPIIRTVLDHLRFMAKLRLALWFTRTPRAVRCQPLAISETRTTAA